MNAAIIVRPDWTDLACRWGAEQLKRKALKYLQGAGWTIVDLYAVKATKQNILSEAWESSYMSILGHGNGTVYTAQEEEYVLVVDDAESLAFAQRSKNRAINALSCSIGQQLAPWLVQNGLRAIKAYTEDFIFQIEESQFPNSTAEPYFLSHCTFDKSIAAGKSCGVAHTDELAEWQNQIAQVNPWSIGYLIWDMQGSSLFGDEAFIPKGTEEPPVPPPPVPPGQAVLQYSIDGGAWQQASELSVRAISQDNPGSQDVRLMINGEVVYP